MDEPSPLPIPRYVSTVYNEIRSLSWRSPITPMTLRTDITASLSFKADGLPAVGRERIALLEAVDREGSISAAARSVGLTYKAAWDGINAMNNLFGQPVVIGQPGGRQGGGATVTEEGRRAITAFHRLDTELSRLMQTLGPALGDNTGGPLLWSLMMRTSARNALRCIVTRVIDGAVNAEIEMAAGDVPLRAIITRESVRDLGIEPGRQVVALIKSSFVILAAAGIGRTSAGNVIPGVVTQREDGAVNTEYVLDIGGGKTIVAIVTTGSADVLDLTLGDKAVALINASHIILAVD